MPIPLELPLADPRPVALPHAPLAPWLRLAHISVGAGVSEAARSRALPDFELVLQVSGSAWIWSGPDSGSVDIEAGDVVFIPPGFAHAWGYGPGSHIAIHFDLHAQPKLPPLRMHEIGRAVSPQPLRSMPTFRLAEPLEPGAPPPVTLALVTHVRRPEIWQERLSQLVELWGRRARSLRALLRAAETLSWAI